MQHRADIARPLHPACFFLVSEDAEDIRVAPPALRTHPAYRAHPALRSHLAFRAHPASLAHPALRALSMAPLAASETPVAPLVFRVDIYRYDLHASVLRRAQKCQSVRESHRIAPVC